jgi:hypothetical protein
MNLNWEASFQGLGPAHAVPLYQAESTVLRVESLLWDLGPAHSAPLYQAESSIPGLESPPITLTECRLLQDILVL